MLMTLQTAKTLDHQNKPFGSGTARQLKAILIKDAAVKDKDPFRVKKEVTFMIALSEDEESEEDQSEGNSAEKSANERTKEEKPHKMIVVNATDEVEEH